MEGFKQVGDRFLQAAGGVHRDSKICAGRHPGLRDSWRWADPSCLYNAKGNLVDGTFREPLTFWPTYYVQYGMRKFSCQGSTWRLVQYTDVARGGEMPSSSLSEPVTWFAIGGYHFTDKLQVGNLLHALRCSG